MKLAFDAADAAGAQRDAGDATRHAAYIAKMRSKFKKEEIDALGQLLDMSTLDAREIERCSTYERSTTYRFERRLRLNPRSDIVGDMLDIQNERIGRDTIEDITGKQFFSRKDASVEITRMYDVRLRIADDDEWLWPAGLISTAALSLVFIPFSAFAIYKRCKARLSSGVTLVLGGYITVNKEAKMISPPPAIGYPLSSGEVPDQPAHPGVTSA